MFVHYHPVLVMRLIVFAVILSVVFAADGRGGIEPNISWSVRLGRVLDTVGTTKPSRETLYQIISIIDAARGSTEAPIDSEFSEYIEQSISEPFRILRLMREMLRYSSTYDRDTFIRYVVKFIAERWLNED